MPRFRASALSAIIFFLILALGVFRSASQKDGFRSINCGGTAFIDQTTKLHWEEDPFNTNNNDMLYGKSSSVHSSFQNITPAMKNLRYFPRERKNVKFCYVLNVSNGSIYLLRTSFLYGNYDGLSKPPNFLLLFNYDEWVNVDASLSTSPIVHELTFVSNGHDLNVCLAPNISSNFDPFISTIELRVLNNTMYIQNSVVASLTNASTTNGLSSATNALSKNYGLMLWRRINYGAITQVDLRYPNDEYDRIWEANTTGPTLSMNPSQAGTYYGQDPQEPPKDVMATAITSSSTQENLSLTYDKYGGAAGGFRIEMHFEELDPNIKAAKSVPRQLMFEFPNSSLHITQATLADLPVLPASSPISIMMDEPLQLPDPFQITLYRYDPATSPAPPLLNAIELFLWTPSPLSTIGTFLDDVYAITLIQENLNMIGYGQGDPCLPKSYAWTWIKCNSDTPPRIIEINLASLNLTGGIPPSISTLTSLQKIDLSHNMLTGPIPDVTNLHALRYLHIGNTGLCDGIACECNSSLTSSTSTPPSFYTKDNSSKKYVFAISFMGALYILLLVIVIIFYKAAHIKKKEEKATSMIYNKKQDDDLKVLPYLTKMFTYNEIKDATINFTTILGEGGFGKVYHGLLPTDEAIAVKLLADASRQGVKEFFNEVAILSRVRHKNLVSLLGYCVENTYMLIYEYIAKGNLKDLLYGDTESTDKPLPWKTRLHIALDASQGLDYLHTGCDPPIIHRDVKSSNILLTDKMQAKVADFGLSRLKEGDTTISHVSTHNVVGTVGYLDPAYNATNHLTDKSDVYSFGVVLFELICGRAPIDMFNNPSYIVEWAKSSIIKGKVEDIVDPLLANGYHVNSMLKVVDMALGCVDNDRIKRPKMRHVSQVLQDALQIEINKSSPPSSKDVSGSSSTTDERGPTLHYIQNIQMTLEPR